VQIGYDLDACTWTASLDIYSTEQWLSAMKSATTPYAPAQRLSPTIVQPPIQSLQQKQIEQSQENHVHGPSIFNMIKAIIHLTMPLQLFSK
jgi:hypothetical protein